MIAAAALDALIALFKRHRWVIIAAPLVLALGVQSWRVRTVKHDLTVARATIAQLEQAGKDARAAQLAANHATEARYRAQAERTDAIHHANLARAADAAGRYADSHRVFADCNRGPGGSPTPAPRDDPARDQRPGAGADLVAVPRAEFDTLTANTARLQAAHDWAAALVRDGLAVAGD